MIERFNYLLTRQKELKEDMIIIEDINKKKIISEKETYDKYSNEIISVNSQIHQYIRSIEEKNNQLKNVEFKIKNNLQNSESKLKRNKDIKYKIKNVNK